MMFMTFCRYGISSKMSICSQFVLFLFYHFYANHGQFNSSFICFDALNSFSFSCIGSLLQAFFKEHPSYSENEFYITGESYAGHYIPAVAERVHRGNKEKLGLPINFKVMRTSYKEYCMFWCNKYPVIGYSPFSLMYHIFQIYYLGFCCVKMHLQVLPSEERVASCRKYIICYKWPFQYMLKL